MATIFGYHAASTGASVWSAQSVKSGAAAVSIAMEPLTAGTGMVNGAEVLLVTGSADETSGIPNRISMAMAAMDNTNVGKWINLCIFIIKLAHPNHSGRDG